MNLKLNTLLFASIGILLSSCGSVDTPVVLYAETANAMVRIDEGFDQEVEYDYMVEGGQLRFQHPHFMDVQMTSVLQNDWVEVREMLETLRETQRLQNQERVFIKMEASIIRALGTVMESNAITLSEADATAFVEYQTALTSTKNNLQTIREELKSLVTELRSLMRSVNRPMMWDDTLITNVKDILSDIIPLTETLTTELSTVLPSLQSVRALLLENIPNDLSPITVEVLAALDAFQTQLVALNALQLEIKSVRQNTRDTIKDIRDIVAAMRANNEELSVADRAALSLKRLAIQDAMASLRSLNNENKDTLSSLRNLISFENLTYINETLITLLDQGEQRLTILETIQTLFLESKAILEA
ncbi:MAG: hypothetical protein ACO207_00455 [Bacilli bacterium]